MDEAGREGESRLHGEATEHYTRQRVHTRWKERFRTLSKVWSSEFMGCLSLFWQQYNAVHLISQQLFG